ncbi:Inositol-1-monophosphatase [Oligella urethralis]|uniref:Inositol-1-monophosphatase n=1 Tax=Oligella urethralis TaxID=90245 RepID=A0A2N6QH33_9BURK|nr:MULTISPECIES: inositol monophosphatase family protein [Oligella]AVL71323.1 inositol monophosphatase [Oligella urethralis]MDK6201882.1 inositol monophosphatase family protein [Oligella urethralis]OFS87846.1 inositol monophosphatase [Oligella sp. HMSC05A10]OFV50614.1 inositol monophosphatase [Oligella sp. HMSC09E12]PMC18820.1 inositol monophosphatase [Oligella urethralis]
MHPMLNTAIKAARRAGNIINRASLHLDKISISTKGPGDYVTDIDRHAEEAIIQILSEAYPDHAFVAEESGITGDSEYRWIIDPLDGTKNFIHGFPNYAVSIALAVRGQIEQAVIYDPNRNELFTASRGGGAFLNDRRIRVSPCPSLDVAIISVASKFSAEHADTQFINELISRSNGFRRLGSTVLELAYLACGRLDAYCGLKQNAWDTAAGSLLVLEAGGLIGDWQGEQNWMRTGNVLAASPKIFAQLVQTLNAAK